MDLKKFNYYYEKAMYLAAFVFFIVAVAKEDIFKAVTAATIVIILMSLNKLISFTKIKLPDAMMTAIYSFIVVAMFLADELGFYSKIPYLDKLEHLASGIILCCLAKVIYDHITAKDDQKSSNKLIPVLFCTFFAIAMAGCWEIFEFSLDHLFGLNCQRGSLWDTMTDIICGTSTSVLTGIYQYVSLTKKERILLTEQHEKIA